MKKIIVANWKMNPLTEREAVKLAKASDQPNAIIAPPFLFLSPVKAVVRKAKLAAQDVSTSETAIGARTGEVSAALVAKLGVRYAIIGHSERRIAGETDAVIAAKLTSALVAGLTPVLCVGEPWAVRRKGFRAATAYVRKQLTEDLVKTKNLKLKTYNLFVAYEPIWAISTSTEHRVETPEDAVVMARFITKQLKTFNLKPTTKVLYGGSVNARNAASFLARPEFSGVLVGGASLKPSEFKKILSTKF